jgi:hypothetical protein
LNNDSVNAKNQDTLRSGLGAFYFLFASLFAFNPCRLQHGGLTPAEIREPQAKTGRERPQWRIGEQRDKWTDRAQVMAAMSAAQSRVPLRYRRRGQSGPLCPFTVDKGL